MGEYKVGDYLIHRHTKQIVEITEITDAMNPYRVRFVDKFNRIGFTTADNFRSNFNKIDINCPVARVLYTSNSNKAVANETNEE